MESDKNSQVQTQMLRRSKRRRENQASQVNTAKHKDTNIVSITDQEKSSLTCAVCSKRYSRIDNLVAHHRSVHSESIIECDVCLQRFASSQGLERHQATHSEDRPHCCSICSRSFKRADSLAVHEESHWKFVEKLECEYEGCHKTFDSYRAYQKHKRSRTDVPYVPPEGTVIAEIECKREGMKWKGKNCLRGLSGQHPASSVQFIISDEEKDHQCVHCFQSFKGCRSFYLHWSTYHSIFERDGSFHRFKHQHRRVGFNCDICHKLFGTKDEIRKHKASRHSV